MDATIGARGIDEVYCTGCGTIIKKDDSFCPRCGKMNREASAPPPPVASPPVMPPAKPAVLPGALRDYSYPPMEASHSGLGTTSFIISLVEVIFFIVIFVLLYNMVSAASWVYDDSDYAIIGLLILFGIIGLVVGVALGIAGVAQRNRKKGLAITGLVLNSVLLLGVIFVEIIGNATPY